MEESRLGAVRVGQAVEVALDALGPQAERRVSEIVPSVDAASRTYIVKIDLPAMPQLRSGMFGRAVFPLAKRTAVVAPPSALVERGQLQSVFVAEDGVAHARLVTWPAHKEAIEVLSGLNAGEKIVAPAPPGLEDGARWRSGRERSPALGPAGRLAGAWIDSKLTPLVIAAALLVGAFAVLKLPREEEPQIIVPMIDVFVADARRLRARGGGARHQAHGEAAVGDPRRRVHLLDVEPGHVDGDRALLRGPGRREEHRPAEPEAARELRPDPAGRLAAAGEAALDRRRADSGADALERALRRFRTAAHRRPGARRHQAGAGRLGRGDHRRPAARDAHHAG